MIAKNEDNYQIMTGNYLETKNVEDLKSKLDLVNSMDKAELKAYYKEVLSNGTRSEKGTAGLGMIDIARKSGKKLDYNFDKIDEEYSFFSLNIRVAQ